MELCWKFPKVTKLNKSKIKCQGEDCFALTGATNLTGESGRRQSSTVYTHPHTPEKRWCANGSVNESSTNESSSFYHLLLRLNLDNSSSGDQHVLMSHMNTFGTHAGSK